ncbi:hypothetical protein GYA28_00040 [Candidatus Roizmanbacteria bacterium]|jgi:hypothetical protein|nr:hypothetical protein [Candidatus Roizmanbacteria bacterium]
MKKRFAVGFILILIAIVFLSSSVWAYFGFNASINHNIFKMGTLSIDFENTDKTPINFDNLQPGSKKQILFTIKNTGNLPVNIAFKLTGKWDDNSLSENVFNITNVEYLNKNDVQWVSIKSNISFGEIVYDSVSNNTNKLNIIEPDESKQFRVSIQLAEDIDNRYQEKYFDAGLTVVAKQTDSNAVWPSF